MLDRNYVHIYLLQLAIISYIFWFAICDS